MDRSIALSDALVDYVNRVGVREHPALTKCREETHARVKDWSVMQIGPDQGAFMALMVQLTGATRILEVGTFTGYSSLAMALALPHDGRIVACDVSEEWTGLARGFWEEAGVAAKIDLRLAPAKETLTAMLGAEDPFDLAFIDADKVNYDVYYEAALKLLKPGGLVLLDNMLWSGAVVDESNTGDDTLAIRALNEKIHDDERVDTCLASIGDGIMMARKR